MKWIKLLSNPSLIAIILLGVAFLIYALLNGTTYQARTVLTKPEQQLYKILKPIETYNRGYSLLCCVRVADIVTIPGGSSKKPSRAWWKKFVKISSKHVDFLIVDEHFKPVLAIELDDKTHLEKDRKKRDIFLDSVFKKAGVPLKRITTKELFQNKVKIQDLGIV